ncbi:MAG: hypothetical protein ACTSUN_03900 [Promethearchaeota archaeon]
MVKIHVIFIGKPQWEAGWPYLGHNNEITINSIISHLKEKFKNVEFSGKEFVNTYNEKSITPIKNGIKQADGVLIFTIGHYGDPGLIKAGIEFIEMGKPTILANLIYAGDHTFTKIYALIKDKNYPCHAISSEKLKDFDKPIDILCSLLKLKGEKVLVHTSDSLKINWERVLGFINPERKNLSQNHPDFLEQIGNLTSDESFEFYTDIVGSDQAHQWRRNEIQYTNVLQEIFGITMVKEEPDEILEYYDNVDKGEAKKIAEKWINNALKVEPSKKTIINSAKLYLAFKKLLKDKNITYYTPDCGSFLLSGKLPAYPCLPFMELYKEGIYGTCESDMDSLISFIYGLTITGRPGFVSNHTIDTINNLITYMHCLAPINVFGNDDRIVPYEIKYHGESHFVGASPYVKFPIGEPVTTIKISIFNKSIEIRTGKIKDNITDERGCVSKMLVESNVKKIMKSYDWDAFGWHRVTFIGDWKNEFILGAKLLGLRVLDLS